MTDETPALESPATMANDWTIANPPPMVTLSEAAAQALTRAQTAVDQAAALRDAILTGIVAQAGVSGGQVVEIKPGPPMVLVLK